MKDDSMRLRVSVSRLHCKYLYQRPKFIIEGHSKQTFPSSFHGLSEQVIKIIIVSSLSKSFQKLILKYNFTLIKNKILITCACSGGDFTVRSMMSQRLQFLCETVNFVSQRGTVSTLRRCSTRQTCAVHIAAGRCVRRNGGTSGCRRKHGHFLMQRFLSLINLRIFNSKISVKNLIEYVE